MQNCVLGEGPRVGAGEKSVRSAPPEEKEQQRQMVLSTQPLEVYS